MAKPQQQVLLDLNNPTFQKQLFALDRDEVVLVIAAFGKLAKLVAEDAHDAFERQLVDVLHCGDEHREAVRVATAREQARRHQRLLDAAALEKVLLADVLRDLEASLDERDLFGDVLVPLPLAALLVGFVEIVHLVIDGRRLLFLARAKVFALLPL